MAHQLVTDFETLLAGLTMSPYLQPVYRGLLRKSHCLNSIPRSILTTLTVWSATAEVTLIKSLRLSSSGTQQTVDVFERVVLLLLKIQQFY